MRLNSELGAYLGLGDEDKNPGAPDLFRKSLRGWQLRTCDHCASTFGLIRHRLLYHPCVHNVGVCLDLDPLTGAVDAWAKVANHRVLGHPATAFALDGLQLKLDNLKPLVHLTGRGAWHEINENNARIPGPSS